MELKPSRRSRLPYVIITIIIVALAILGGLAYFRPTVVETADRIRQLRAWFGNPAAHPEWQVQVGERCGAALMLMPTSGYIGFGWGDNFRPGHAHSGFDIFSPDGELNKTPVLAAYEGYLTRESDWRSAVIIRHPDFPTPRIPGLVFGEQIWTYYTHMASTDGETSFISEEFPAGTFEIFIEEGTLLGYQGNWSGNPASPTGLHLHFSVVKSTLSGGYRNETDIENTYDPTPFLGVQPNEDGVSVCPST